MKQLHMDSNMGEDVGIRLFEGLSYAAYTRVRVRLNARIYNRLLSVQNRVRQGVLRL